MEPEYITRKEHDEFARRMEEEHHRQNRRIELLEEEVRQISSIAVSVEKLATNMEGMLKEQERQGDRLDKLEREPADAWKNAKTTIITAILSTIAGGVATGLIFMLSQSITRGGI